MELPLAGIKPGLRFFLEVKLVETRIVLGGKEYSEADYELFKRFVAHKPDAETLGKMNAIKMNAIRRKARELAFLIQESCPASKEKEAAFTQLQTVMMLANSAIVQQYPIDERDL